MTTFLRLLQSTDKSSDLIALIQAFRDGIEHPLLFSKDVQLFKSIPTSPMPYWAPKNLLEANQKYEAFEPKFGSVRVGAQTNDDFRFVRCFWEIKSDQKKWIWHLKNDTSSSYYDEINTVVNWRNDAKELKEFITRSLDGGHWSKRIFNSEFFFRPGLSWALRTSKFSPSCVPSGCIPTGTRYLAISEKYDPLVLLALWNSLAINALCKLRAERHVFIVGLVKLLPTPNLTEGIQKKLKDLALECWKIKKNIASFNETSLAFVLPKKLIATNENHVNEIAFLQSQIDSIVSEIFEFQQLNLEDLFVESASDIDESEEVEEEQNSNDNCVHKESEEFELLSWAIGVAFGHFDWRLATSERALPPEKAPFDSLPDRSPGMLPDGAEPFQAHFGILVDDPRNTLDLARLTEKVLTRVNLPVPDNVRYWLHNDFFTFHLLRYSKSRRKAPIYWPLSTASGSYALWVYYPSLNNQTLFTAVNDFLDGPNGKLTQVSRECAELRMKGSSRSRDEEKQYETLQAFEQELTDLRDTLLKIAPTYQPNHNDGVQITAAPLWPLFRHKPWQKVLKDTWSKLEKGDYDWAHLAMAYWPERVREKCKIDKSLAIAHGLEDLYVESEAAPKKTRGKKKSGVEE